MMLKDMKISTRLTILLVVLLTVLEMVGGAGLYATGKLNKAMQSIHDDRMMPIVHLYTIHTANLGNGLAIAKAIAHPENIAQYIQEIEQAKSLIDKEWDIYMTIIHKDAQDVAEDKGLIMKFAEARRHFFEQGIKPALAAMRAHDLAEVIRIQNEYVLPLTPPLHETLSLLINMETSEASLAHEQGESLFSRNRALFVTLILFSVTLGGTLGFSIIRSVNRSVSELRGVMVQMSADGDLTMRARVYSKDEIGQTAADFNVLLDSLNNLSELQQVFDNLDEGIVFIDQQRRVIAINAAANRLLGQHGDEALNKLCPDIFQQMDCAQDCKNNEHCKRMSEDRQEMQDITVRRPDGALVNLRMSAIGLPSKGSLVLRGCHW